ncbi:hypothetical protein MSG28_014363 [Choristoneura fumiferana]|uniref:Uncharacterized protein n=1 Tax=Choristoneura fumiferana TaxID=7141 RepID=A0ACC0JGZ4_CHOFU|nr:hypothetical protein MSG28_014363 [Choristoneura fumiferana]
MSGRLVVLDRGGRAGKRFPLAAGLATLGRGAGCDIRVLLPAVSQHHATITVHANQMNDWSRALARLDTAGVLVKCGNK